MNWEFQIFRPFMEGQSGQIRGGNLLSTFHRIAQTKSRIFPPQTSSHLMEPIHHAVFV